ncbi:type III secretion protein C [Mesorhizobium sp. J18]|uniref:type III secretion protein n=1 Tax=Mesorhizobium sp. J18 TaxID=935263 RepID=UPI00119C8A65|nr:type III secretion protein [Mesorhizobium sp. J18]TWG99550.1 type III secretion protein C [Mesorhizobium sp. J18]
MQFSTDRSGRLFTSMLGLMTSLWLCGAATTVMAAEPDWPAGTYKYITIDQDVREALEEFGRNVGLPVQVSDRVQGRLNHGMPVGTAKEFLEWICNRYGLVWFYDGTVLHVAAEGEVRTEMVKLPAEDARVMRTRLDRLQMSDPRFPIRFLEEENIMSVSGPPAYVGAVKNALGLMSGPATSHVARDGESMKRSAAQVRVFRGRSAEAESVPVNSRQ